MLRMSSRKTSEKIDVCQSSAADASLQGVEPRGGLHNVPSPTCGDRSSQLQVKIFPEEKDENGHLIQICKSCKRPPHPSLHRSAVGQFTISLTKVCGSLGFTLRQLDDTVLKHTIKVRLTLSHITTIKKQTHHQGAAHTSPHSRKTTALQICDGQL